MTHPLAIIEGMTVLFCVVLLVEGISQVLSFLGDKSEAQSSWRLLEGMVSIVIGILIIFGNTKSFSIGIIILFGLWLIFISFSKLMMSLRVLKYEKNIGQRLVFIAVIQLILGVIITVLPGVVGAFISVFFAVALFVQAIATIFRFFRLNRLDRKMR